jgi:hypothetical protein
MKKMIILSSFMIVAIAIFATSARETLKSEYLVNELLQVVKKIENVAKSRELVPVEVLHQNWENEQWVNDQLQIYSYDENGFLVEIVYKEWEENEWIISFRAVSTNNEFGWPLETYMQIWDSNNNIWLDMAHYTTNYNEDGWPLYSLIQVNFNGVWTNMMQMTYSWSGDLLMEILFEVWDSALNIWENMELTTYDYEGEDLIQLLEQEWDGNVWLNDEIEYFTYDNNHHLLEELKKHWSDNAWWNEKFDTYVYDNQWHELEQLTKIWNNESWQDYEIKYQTWNSDFVVERLVQRWENGRIWVNESYVTITYGEAFSPEDVLAQSMIMANYPNPFNPTTTISFSLSKNSDVTTLEIFNSKGQLVKTLIHSSLPVGNYRVEWNGKNEQQESVASGIYFYRLVSGKSAQIRKMILMK